MSATPLRPSSCQAVGQGLDAVIHRSQLRFYPSERQGGLVAHIGANLIDEHENFGETMLNAHRQRQRLPPMQRQITWAAILPAGVPAPAQGVLVRAAHLEALRQRFTSALQALGVAATAYTNPNLATEPLIRAVHLTELQQRMQ